jgi:hypothetical protein
MLVYFMAIWNIWQPFGIPYSHLVHFWSFGVFLHVLVCFTHINLATLPQTHFAGAVDIQSVRSFEAVAERGL